MTKRMYAIRDDVACVVMPPFIEVNDEAAIRGFEYAMANGNGISSFRPTDFCLLYIGTYDDSNGVVVPELPTVLVRGNAGDRS